MADQASQYLQKSQHFAVNKLYEEIKIVIESRKGSEPLHKSEPAKVAHAMRGNVIF